MRLQAETLAPSAFLRSFLSSHEGWGAALPVLREDTLRQQRVGLGFEVRVPRAVTRASMAIAMAIAVPCCSWVERAGHVARGAHEAWDDSLAMVPQVSEYFQPPLGCIRPFGRLAEAERGFYDFIPVPQTDFD